MCTVTFIAGQNGYALGMNRDEKVTRVTARPPARFCLAGRTVLCPSEPGGGTWIGVNDAGSTLALINWYSAPARVHGNSVSRGDVVRSALPADSASSIERVLAKLPLDRVNPFRLIGVFPQSSDLIEWRWDLIRLDRFDQRWETSTWISSGFDEAGAQVTRGRAFSEALRHPSAGSMNWLRRLHRSHGPEQGPYSTCMHREDAVTVSYTEVLVTLRMATMRYTPGPPCCGITLSDRTPAVPSSAQQNDRKLCLYSTLPSRTHVSQLFLRRNVVAARANSNCDLKPCASRSG